MATYLLTYNTDRWAWNDIDSAIEQLRENGSYIDSWSSGNRKDIKVGERVFVIKLGTEPRGIFISGWVYNGHFLDKHWDKEKAKQGKKANYIEVNFEVILNPEKDRILSYEELNKGKLKNMDWSSRASGVLIPEEIAEELENKWDNIVNKRFKNSNNRPELIPEEIVNSDRYIEGAAKSIVVNKYERNAKAREKCLEAHGYKCNACDTNLEDIYGEIAKDFIHVHHIVPLSDIKEEYKLNPVEDLIPICPNCHSIIHRYKPILTVEELRRLIYKTRNRNSKD